MQSHLTSFTLTKMITFTSYFSFHNKSDLEVEISECSDIWLLVEPGKKIDFWPEKIDRFLVARLKGVDDSVSVKFRLVFFINSWLMSVLYRPLAQLLSAYAIGTGGLGFKSRVGQIGTVSSMALHRCDVSSEVRSPGAKPRRWARHSLRASA